MGGQVSTATQTYTVTVNRPAAATPTTPTNVLVSNLGQTAIGGGSAINNVGLTAQSFSVPSGGGNYTLASIEMDLGGNISSTNIGSLTVVVWSADTSGHPASSLYTLTNPASITTGTASFTAPAGATLEAGNTYVVVGDYNVAAQISWKSTNSDNEDATSMTGWTIADTGLWYSRTGTSWTARPFALRLRVNGTAVGGTPPVSTDATLSGLAVDDGSTNLALTPTFASATYEYTAMVASAVDEVTVTPTTTDDGATIEWLDASDATIDDANTSTTGQQVTLTDGDNVIKVKVTAADKSTSLTYTVTVNRAAAASTCTLNTGDGDIWCGVVTVGALGGQLAAYGFSDPISEGDLSDKMFSVVTNGVTTPYTIDSVSTGTGVGSGVLSFGLASTALTEADRAKLILHVDGSSDSFGFSDAADPTATYTYTWSGTGLDWMSTSEVTLRLREAATPPDAPTNFTATVGDAQVTLACKAAGLDSGVTRHEFRFKTDGSYPLTWTAIENSGPDEANEDSFTVTGLTNEVAHTFELRAVSAGGNSEEEEAGPVTPTPGICDRTQKIQDVILAELSGVDDCAAVTVANLASITSFGFNGNGTHNQGITTLQAGDFAGLTSLFIITLEQNGLTSLPPDVFSDLTSLVTLSLNDNALDSLPPDVFSGLTSLVTITLPGIPQIKPTFLDLAPSGIPSNIIPHSKGVKCGLIRSNSPFSYSNHRPAKPKIPKPLVYAQVSPLGTSFATP